MIGPAGTIGHDVRSLDDLARTHRAAGSRLNLLAGEARSCDQVERWHELAVAAARHLGAAQAYERVTDGLAKLSASEARQVPERVSTQVIESFAAEATAQELVPGAWWVVCGYGQLECGDRADAQATVLDFDGAGGIGCSPHHVEWRCASSSSVAA